MKRLLVLGTIAAVALSTTTEAKPHNEKKAARQVVATQRINNAGTTTIARSRNRTVARQYYGNRGYYGRGYNRYNRSGTSISIGIGSGYGYGYPGYGYGYGYPYSYGYGGYPSSYNSYYGDGYSEGYNVVAQVQRRLARAGYYHGVIDGAAGPRTRAAIARWEARHGMYADGRIDRSLLRSLGLS